MENPVYIDTREALDEAFTEWDAEEVLGIDTECENNLHYFGTYLSIIQVSSKEKTI